MIFPTGKARYDGFRRAHAEAKRKIDKTLVELGAPDIQFGADAVKRLLAQRPAPTAIVTSSVLVTLGAAGQVAESGIDVPGDLSFFGFGDGPWQKWWGPGLTTLRLPTEELATGCGLWLLHRLKSGRQPARGAPHVAISPTLIVPRGSTARPRSA